MHTSEHNSLEQIFSPVHDTVNGSHEKAQRHEDARGDGHLHRPLVSIVGNYATDKKRLVHTFFLFKLTKITIKSLLRCLSQKRFHQFNPKVSY